MTQFNTTAAFGEFSKSSVDAALQFARVGFTGVEQLLALNLEAAKVGFNETTKTTQALVNAKDVQELNALRSNVAESSLEFAFGYGKNFYSLATATQAQYSALVEERVNAVQKNLVDTLDKVAKSAPTGSDAIFTALKSGLAASATAFDTVSKATKQATAFADTAFKAAAETTEKATKPAAKRK